jgi:hypothetical protein
MASSRAVMNLSTASIGLARRSFATSSQSFLTKTRPSSQIRFDKNKLQQHFRRTYADVAPAKKPRRFRFFRNLWRLTYLSAIGGTAYLAYGVWELRHPEEQFVPDPTKKNLVILGKYSLSVILRDTNSLLRRESMPSLISCSELQGGEMWDLTQPARESYQELASILASISLSLFIGATASFDRVSVD